MPGRWAGGFRAWDEHGVYLATGRGVARGRLLRVPASALRELCDRWFPFGGHLIEGLYGTARTIESTARQRESLVTPGHPGGGAGPRDQQPGRGRDPRGRRARGCLPDAAVLAGPAGAGEISADPVRGAGRPARARSRPVRRSWTRWRWPTSRTPSRPGWRRTASRGTGSSRRPWPLPVSKLPGASGRPPCCRQPALEPALEWVASTLTTATLLGELKESTRRISELVAADPVVHPDGPRLAAAHRRDRRPGEHPGHARPQAP